MSSRRRFENKCGQNEPTDAKVAWKLAAWRVRVIYGRDGEAVGGARTSLARSQ